MFELPFKNIDNKLKRTKVVVVNYIILNNPPWVLFFKYLEDIEKDKATEAALYGKS
jgi:hypothetical protein